MSFYIKVLSICGLGFPQGSWNQCPEEAEGQLHSVTLTTHVLAHLQSPVWTFYLEYVVLGGTQLPWKGGWSISQSQSAPPLELHKDLQGRQCQQLAPLPLANSFGSTPLFFWNYDVFCEAGKDCEKSPSSCFSIWAEWNSAFADSWAVLYKPPHASSTSYLFVSKPCSSPKQAFTVFT